MNRSRKGNYYRKKTKDWMEAQGYEVFITEQTQTLWDSKKKRAFHIKRDLAGADLLAMNGKEIIFIQVKSNKNDILKGAKELGQHKYPPCVKLWVVYWVPRAKEPLIEEVEIWAK